MNAINTKRSFANKTLLLVISCFILVSCNKRKETYIYDSLSDQSKTNIDQKQQADCIKDESTLFDNLSTNTSEAFTDLEAGDTFEVKDNGGETSKVIILYVSASNLYFYIQGNSSMNDINGYDIFSIDRVYKYRLLDHVAHIDDILAEYCNSSTYSNNTHNSSSTAFEYTLIEEREDAINGTSTEIKQAFALPTKRPAFFQFFDVLYSEQALDENGDADGDAKSSEYTVEQIADTDVEDTDFIDDIQAATQCVFVDQDTCSSIDDTTCTVINLYSVPPTDSCQSASLTSPLFEVPGFEL
ncbi:MAG: hypothetical protein H6621_12555 [Halobacteriovoraceae bacterium]|nr:hypothetical protein [Halobacteriovoraceae bacterium]